MKNLIRLWPLILIFFILSCRRGNLETVTNPVDSSKISKIKKVLILGNSIVQEDPLPALGWYGNWGMAASIIDSDFVHILMNRIHYKDSSVVIKYKNIANFEFDFVGFPFSDLDSLRNPDMLILKISENVDEKKAVDSNFLKYYDQLVRYIDSNQNSVNVIVDGFWDKPDVNGMIRLYTIQNKLPFITITDLSRDPANEAGSRYADAGISAHPSDQGMRKIADRIWAYTQVYFK
jgi:alpha-galactosidase